jgi:hypothetical protein
MHVFRASVIATFLAIAHSLPLNPQASSARYVHGDGDILTERVPCEDPQLPADTPPSVAPSNKAHVVKQDQRIITFPPSDTSQEPPRLKLDARDVHIKGTKQGQVEGADVHVKGTKQGQVDDDVNRSRDGAKEQSQGLATGKRIH